MSGLLSQVGMKKETTWATPVTVDRFFEVNEPPHFKLDAGRVVSDGIQTGLVVQRDDKLVPYHAGGSYALVMDVPTKGFGGMLEQMLGTIVTSGPTDSNYTHTATMVQGNLRGKSATWQGGRALTSGTVQPFTGNGGKVLSWSLGCDAKGKLVLRATIDFQDIVTSTGLAVASYVTSYIFAFVGGTVTIAGSSVPLTTFEVACDNKLKTDRVYLQGSGLKAEPLEAGWRVPTWKAVADLTDLTQYNRFSASAAASTKAQIVATFQGPVAHAGATLPSVVVTIPSARFDADDLAGSLEPTMQSMSGPCQTPAAGGSPVTIAYTTNDATP